MLIDKMSCRVALGTLLLLPLASGFGWTQGAPEIAWRESYYNPVPLEDDLILPMPCGGAMAFRPVVTPHAGGALGDLPIFLGDERSKFDYLRGLRRAQISGPFMARVSRSRQYFIAKYETAQVQYDVVTKGCPDKTPRRRAFVAASGLSWFDAVAFSRDYTEWLWQNARDTLPNADGVPAFVRLPLEAEWEFAARGGARVDDVEFRQRLPNTDGASLAEFVAFGGSESANGKVQPIGTLRPNALGLHDMLGNVAEMTLDPFQLNRYGRQHGLSGAFVVRGGNARTPREQISHGARQEAPYFDVRSGDASGDRYTGFRVALGVTVFTTADREAAFRDEYAALAAPDQSTQTGLKEDEALSILRTAERDNTYLELAPALQSVRRLLDEARVERQAQRDRATQNQLLAAALSCNRVSGLIRSQRGQLPLAEMADEEFQSVLSRNNPAEIAEARMLVDSIKQDLAQVEDAITSALSFYGTLIEALATDYPLDELRTQAELVSEKQTSRNATSMLPCLSVVLAHISLRIQSGVLDSEQWREDFG